MQRSAALGHCSSFWNIQPLAFHLNFLHPRNPEFYKEWSCSELTSNSTKEEKTNSADKYCKYYLKWDNCNMKCWYWPAQIFCFLSLTHRYYDIASSPAFQGSYLVCRCRGEPIRADGSCSESLVHQYLTSRLQTDRISSKLWCSLLWYPDIFNIYNNRSK